MKMSHTLNDEHSIEAPCEKNQFASFGNWKVFVCLRVTGTRNNKELKLFFHYFIFRKRVEELFEEKKYWITKSIWHFVLCCYHNCKQMIMSAIRFIKQQQMLYFVQESLTMKYKERKIIDNDDRYLTRIILIKKK
jgi:hypothetical protein